MNWGRASGPGRGIVAVVTAAYKILCAATQTKMIKSVAESAMAPAVGAHLRCVVRIGLRSFSSKSVVGPHLALASPGPRQSSKAHLFGPSEMFTLELFDRLWDQYRQRVSYVRKYEEVISQHGATFFNDHIALRTIAVQVDP